MRTKKIIAQGQEIKMQKAQRKEKKQKINEIKKLLALNPELRVEKIKERVNDFRLNFLQVEKKLNTLEGWTEKKAIAKINSNPIVKEKIMKAPSYKRYNDVTMNLQGYPKPAILKAIFGEWNNLLKAANGEKYDPNEITKPIKKISPEERMHKMLSRQNSALKNNPEYQLKTIIKFRLWTLKAYREAFYKYREAVPHFSQVYKQWGNFINAREAALRYCFTGRMALFLQFCEKISRMPTSEECKSIGISLEEIKENFGDSFEAVKAAILQSKKKQPNR